MYPELQTGTFALFQKLQSPSGTVWAYDQQLRTPAEVARWVREQEVLMHVTKNNPETRIVGYKIVPLED
jgi:hypothetical protein